MKKIMQPDELYMALHFEEPVLDTWRHGMPELRTRPCVLADTVQRRVVAACPNSEALGIRPGLSLVSARSLADALVVLTASPQQRQQVMETLAEHALQFSDQVCVPEGTTLVMECASLLRLFGGLDSYWQQVAGYFRDMGYRLHPATGTTPAQAQVLAQQGMGLATTSAPALQQQARRLPVTALPLPDRTVENLLRTGLDTLEQLCAIPERELGRRFGPELLTLLRQLMAREREPLNVFEPPPHFDQYLELPEDIEHAQALLFPLRRLLAGLEQCLHLRACQVSRITLTLTLRRGSPMTLTLERPFGTHRAEHWLSLCQLRFERLVLPAPVRTVRLSTGDFQPRTAQTDDLFGPTSSPLTRIHQLIARLHTRLGNQRLHRLGRHADHRPERAGTLDGQLAKLPPDDSPRPLALLPHPMPVPHTRLQRLEGPERLVCGWWDHAPVQRDYYLARLDDGRLCWAFHTPSGHWFIHGWFS